MAVSIIDIDVNDESFKRFSALWQKYLTELDKTPQKWAAVNAQVGASAQGYQQITAAIFAQTQVLQRMAAAQGQIATQTERSSRYWRDLSRYAKDFKGSIEEATTSLLKWGQIAGVLTGLIGGGGLFGINRLAQGVAAGRQSSLGLGTTYGGQSAFNLNFGRFVDSNSFLSGVANSKLDPRKRVGLLAAGLTDKEIEGDTATTGAALLRNLFRIADTTPKQNYGTTLEALRQNDYLSPQDLQRLHDTPQSERDAQFGAFGRDRSSLNLPGDTQRAWQDLTTQLSRAGTQIENTLIRGLVPLAGPLAQISTSFEKFAAAALASPQLGKWIDDVASGFSKMAAAFESPGKLMDMVFGRHDSDSIVDRMTRRAGDTLLGQPYDDPARGSTGGGKMMPLPRSMTAPAGGMDPEFQRRLNALISSVPGSLGMANITSGYRSEAEQEALRRHNPSGYPVAQGTSEHTTGTAADLAGNPAVMKYLHDHAKDFGLDFPMSNDPVHVHMTKDKQSSYRDSKVVITVANNTGGNAAVSINAMRG